MGGLHKVCRWDGLRCYVVHTKFHKYWFLVKSKVVPVLHELSTTPRRCMYLYPPRAERPSYTTRHLVPFSSPPSTRRAKVEVFDPTSTRDIQPTVESSRIRITTEGQSSGVSWNKAPSGAYDQIFITVRQLQACWCGALSLPRGRVCHLQLLLILASAVIDVTRGTRDHILLSQTWDFPFLRLLRFAGLRWRYSKPPRHGSQPTVKSKSKSKLCYDQRFSRPICLGIKHPSEAYD
jgi:hypothetical protein